MIVKNFQLVLSLDTGSLTGIKVKKLIVRRLSDMIDFFYDKGAVARMISSGIDPVIYEVYGFETPSMDGQLSLGVTILKPGKIGSEYYMTKGHFHVKDASEIYLCLKGNGFLILQDKKGETEIFEIKRDSLIYISLLDGLIELLTLVRMSSFS